MNKIFKEGDKVTYDDGFKGEHGIIKSIQDKDYAFVVYHWNGESGDYRDYTAARTRISDLKKGWIK